MAYISRAFIRRIKVFLWYFYFKSWKKFLLWRSKNTTSKYDRRRSINKMHLLIRQTFQAVIPSQKKRKSPAIDCYEFMISTEASRLLESKITLFKACHCSWGLKRRKRKPRFGLNLNAFECYFQKISWWKHIDNNNSLRNFTWKKKKYNFYFA